jgi:hypothetical protein
MTIFMSPADDFTESPVERKKEPDFPSMELPDSISMFPDESLPLPLDMCKPPLLELSESNDVIEMCPESPRILRPDERSKFPPDSSLFVVPEVSLIVPPVPTKEFPAERDRSPPEVAGELGLPPVEDPAEISKFPARVPLPAEKDKSPAFPSFDKPVEILIDPELPDVALPVAKSILPDKTSPLPVATLIDPDDAFPDPDENIMSPPSVKELDPDDKSTLPPAPEVEEPTRNSIDPESPRDELPVDKVIGPLAFSALPVAKSIEPLLPELEPEASVKEPLSELAPDVEGVIILTPPL